MTDAVRRGSDFIAGWRVLSAHTDRNGQLQPISPDWSALRVSGKPIIAVVRIDRPLTGGGDAQALAELSALLTRWRKGGIALAGLEIDYDSPTARLRDYRDFLASLRSALDPAIRLSITALPTWLSSPDLSGVLQAADESVLQVHSVIAGDRKLFDRGQAERWIAAMAAATRKPFRIALPAYGERLADGEELRVSPEEVAELIRRENRFRPAHLAGFVWFRLPTADDAGTWSLATLRVVIQGESLEPHLSVSVRDGDTPGLSILALSNDGATDVTLPKRLELPPACTMADGANGYRIEKGERLAFVRSDGALLHETEQRVAGWARCRLDPGDIHVSP